MLSEFFCVSPFPLDFFTDVTESDPLFEAIDSIGTSMISDNSWNFSFSPERLCLCGDPVSTTFPVSKPAVILFPSENVILATLSEMAPAFPTFAGFEFDLASLILALAGGGLSLKSAPEKYNEKCLKRYKIKPNLYTVKFQNFPVQNI
jgi:hypothetical protein